MLSRRAFQNGLLAAGLCPSLPGHRLPEPHMRLELPPEAPATVALTFDACGGGTDMRILRTLLDLGIPATIFATGLWLRNNPAIIPLLRDRPEQFSVQNHGARHLPPVLGTRPIYGLAPAGTLDAIRNEVAGGAAAVTAAGFPAPAWYRGATALYSPAAIDLIEAMGFRIGGFSVNADAGASLPAATVARNIEAARTADVIIAHINQPHRASGAGVAQGIAGLHASGTRFVTLAGALTRITGC